MKKKMKRRRVEKIRGRHLEGVIKKISSHHVPVSFPRSKIHLLALLHKMIEGGVYASLSSLIVDAVELTYGSSDIADIENLIVEEYAVKYNQHYESFAELLEDTTRRIGIVGFADQWNLQPEQLARLLYKYCRSLPDKVT